MSDVWIYPKVDDVPIEYQQLAEQSYREGWSFAARHGMAAIGTLITIPGNLSKEEQEIWHRCYGYGIFAGACTLNGYSKEWIIERLELAQSQRNDKLEFNLAQPYHPPLELQLKSQPPVASDLVADQLDSIQPIDGRYFSVDLNEDGTNEHFVVTHCGAHSMAFRIIGSEGTPIEQNDLGGDRLVILNSKNNGFCDLICSYIDPWAVIERYYRFNGQRYIAETSSTNLLSAGVEYVEKQPNKALACWYSDSISKADVWGPPPPMESLDGPADYINKTAHISGNIDFPKRDP
jgi:hypothetical protein